MEWIGEVPGAILRLLLRPLGCRSRTGGGNPVLPPEEFGRGAPWPATARPAVLAHVPGILDNLLHGHGATARARRLLFAHLTAEQRRHFERRGYFVVRGGQSADAYQVWAGSTWNVVRVRDRVQFCFHPSLGWSGESRLPLPDILLGQALMLRHAEARVLALTRPGLGQTPPGVRTQIF